MGFANQLLPLYCHPVMPQCCHLVHVLPTLFSSHYKCLMLPAMMVLAFKGYVHIHEMVPWSRSTVSGRLHVSDVMLSSDLITAAKHILLFASPDSSPILHGEFYMALEQLLKYHI